MSTRRRLPLAVIALLFVVAAAVHTQKPSSGVTPSAFGTMPDGKPVQQFTLKNNNGIELTAIGYGGIITSLRVPDRAGKTDDIVLGFDRLDDYLKDHPFFGAIIGRYGNRIAKGQFTLDGQTYK